MSDNPSSPLLGEAGPANTRPASNRSTRSIPSTHDHESSPLLARTDNTPRYDGEDESENRLPSPAASSLRTLQNGSSSKKSDRKRWPTAVAISLLVTLVVLAMVGGFFGPAVVEEYAKQAVVVEPTNLSIDSFTPTGVRARIQANFRLDASRVQKKPIRDLGRFGTWIARQIESEESKLHVYLPEYGNILLGTAHIPGVVVDIRNGYTTHVDFLTDLEPGNLDDIRNLANDWIDGRLGALRVQGQADVALKSGIFSLGSQSISESYVLEGSKIPGTPAYNMTRFNIHEVLLPTGGKAMAADVAISLVNPYPVKFSVPPLGFDIMVPNCATTPYISVVDAITDIIEIEPKSEVNVKVGGVVRKLPESLIKTCPDSNSSPLDSLLGGYVHGRDTTLFVRGSNAPSDRTPGWITKIISSVIVPVPFPGHTFDGAIKNFSLAQVHFSLPDPWAEPGTPESNPRVSGDIKVLAKIPEQMNFGVNITRVRASADVYYEGSKLGFLNLHKWQAANSTRINGTETSAPALKIQSHIEQAPLIVTNDTVFSDVISKLLMGGKGVLLNIKANVTADVKTVLGNLIVKDLPAEGNVPIKAPIDRGFGGLAPKIGNLTILDTTKTSILLSAMVNITNPTPYTAHVPYVNVQILSNGSVLGEATARNLDVVAGNNTNILVEALWDPYTFGGDTGTQVGRDLLSQYICGWNTSLTLRTHEGTIPTQPALGRALSKFNLTLATPKLTPPDNNDGGDGDEGDDKPHFIKGATFHLLSSTAQFTLLSPLQKTPLYIDFINATAFYNHTENVGHIDYDLPFEVPAGKEYTTPRLPVAWSLGSVGYDAVRSALGGSLKLDAVADVGIRLGRWSEKVWFVGGGIGASVRL